MGHCVSVKVNAGRGNKSPATTQVTLELTNDTLERKFAFLENPGILMLLQKQPTGYKQLVANYLTLLMIDRNDTDGLISIMRERCMTIKQFENERAGSDLTALFGAWQAFLQEYLRKLQAIQKLKTPIQISEIINLTIEETFQFSCELLMVLAIFNLKLAKREGRNFWEKEYFFERKFALNDAKYQLTQKNMMVDSDLDNLIQERSIISAPLFEMILFIKYMALILTFDMNPSLEILHSQYGHGSPMINGQPVISILKPGQQPPMYQELLQRPPSSANQRLSFSQIKEQMSERQGATSNSKKDQIWSDNAAKLRSGLSQSVQNEIVSQEVPVDLRCKQHSFMVVKKIVKPD